MNQEQYIDHEVRMRVTEELIKRIDTKMNLMIGLLIGSVVIPVFLHIYKLV